MKTDVDQHIGRVVEQASGAVANPTRGIDRAAGGCGPPAGARDRAARASARTSVRARATGEQTPHRQASDGRNAAFRRAHRRARPRWTGRSSATYGRARCRPSAPARVPPQRRGLPVTRASTRDLDSIQRWAAIRRGGGFEPPMDGNAHTGFRDRRGVPESPLNTGRRAPGESRVESPPHREARSSCLSARYRASVSRACSMSAGSVCVYLRSVMSAAPNCRAGVEWPIR